LKAKEKEEEEAVMTQSQKKVTAWSIMKVVNDNDEIK
jgi:hypothetical protein